MKTLVAFLSSFGMPASQWWVAGGVFLVTAAGIHVLIRLVRRRLSHWARRTETSVDDIFDVAMAATQAWFGPVAAVLVAVQVLDLPARVTSMIVTAATILLLLQAALWGHSAIGAALGRLSRPDGVDNVVAGSATALTFVVRVVFWSTILLLMLANVGVDVTAVVAGLGVGGIAVALAVQNILGDLFASLAIALDKPVVLGDFIVMDDFAGSVEHIGLKTVQLRSISGEQIILANSDLLSSRIRNYKRMNERRVVLEIGVTYETRREQLRCIADILKKIVSAAADVRLDRAHLKGFGASSLDFEVVYYVLSPDYGAYMDAQQRIALRIIEDFDERGIEFAYPTQTVHIAGDRV